MQTIKPETSPRGFALLIALITISAVLAITLSLIELTLKQLDLSVDARDSEITFQATNAGIECAQRVRRVQATALESGAAANFQCFGSNPSVTSNTTGLTEQNPNQGNIYRYTTSITWGAASAQRCTEIDMVVLVSDLDAATGVGASGLSGLYAGYANSKTCPPGGRCTIAVSRGYNAPCASKTNAGVLRREILLEF